jgi:hypothetical protein
MAAVGWAAEWQAAAHMEVGLVQARMAIAALLKAKIAQLAASAVEETVRVRWLTWAVAEEITSRRLRTSTSAVAAISLDPVEILLA